jgi:cell volume regulation protein A
MGLEELAMGTFLGALIVLIAIFSVRFAGKLGVPGLLMYLFLGLVLGATVPALYFDDATLATVLGYSALILILANGGLTTKVDQLRPVLGPSLALASVGIAVSIGVVALPLIFIFDFDPQLAVLLGTVLAATDAAAVFSLLGRMRVNNKVRTLLEAEAGFNDAPVVVIVSIVASGSWGETAAWLIPILVVAEIIGGAIIGIAVGYLGRFVLPRLALPGVGLYPIAALALIVFSYGAASVLHASGFMAVYISAILIGSAKKLPHRRSILGFSDGLSWIAEIGLFVMLGLLAEVGRLPEAIPLALGAVVLLVFFARPLAAIVSLAPFRMGTRVIAFVSIAGLRGAVPIVFAAIPLGFGIPGAELVFDATLIVVFLLLLFQTPVIAVLGRKIGVCLPEQLRELEVESAPLDGMSATVLGVDVPKGSALVGVFVVEMGLPRGALVSLVIREGVAEVPREETRIRAEDQLVIVATLDVQAQTEERIRLLALGGRLARWYGFTALPSSRDQ